jgi:hypothetical protein
MTQRYYVAGDGTKYPLEEALTPFAITVFRSDCKKAVVGDPWNCLIAIGARRTANVIAAYIGASRDAYVIMKFGRTGKPTAFHFIINAKAARIRDAFDTNKNLKSQVIMLSPPTPGRTLDYRATLNKRRRGEVKAGAVVKKQTKKERTTRLTRIGVPLRPRAQIVSNAVTVPAKAAANKEG